MYNIEVDGDHCYRVGEQGLLVHNASAVWTGPTHESCTARVGHCPQLDGSTGFSTTPAFETQTSQVHYGIILDKAGGVEVSRYYKLPKGFKAIVTKTGGGSGADPRILPPGWDPMANIPGSVVIHRGHLLANDLGGPGGINDGGPMNLVTQSKGTNLVVMKGIEDGIKTLIGQGKSVHYQIVVEYSKGPKPSVLRVRACAKVDKEEYDATFVSHWDQGISVS